MRIMTFDNCGNIIEIPYSNKIALYKELVALRNRYEIMKANYETRLKADMVAMLEKLYMEIEGLDTPSDDDSYDAGIVDCEALIQEKINSLKGVEK